jgi:hypothetical protein
MPSFGDIMEREVDSEGTRLSQPAGARRDRQLKGPLIMRTMTIAAIACLIATGAGAASLAPRNATIIATGLVDFGDAGCDGGTMTITINKNGVGKIRNLTCPSVTFSRFPWLLKANSLIHATIYGISGTTASENCPPRDRPTTVEGAVGIFLIQGRGPCNIYAEMTTKPAMSIVP